MLFCDLSSQFQSVFCVNCDKGVDSGNEVPSRSKDLFEGNVSGLGGVPRVKLLA